MSLLTTITAPNAMCVTFLSVTPKKALEWLAHNKSNRRIRPGAVKAYKDDMNAGKWRTIPHAICFGSDGTLLNGQHTLTALSQAEVPFLWLMVAHNVPVNVAAVMESGIRRSLNDQLTLEGIEDIKGKYLSLATAIESGERHFNVSGKTSKFTSYNTRLAQFRTHKDSILFVEAAGFRAAIPVLAVLCRAYYSVPHDRLGAFIQTLRDGLSSTPNNPAICLRDFIMRIRSSTGAAASVELYQKTQSALKAYLKGASITKLCAAAGDVYGNVPITE